VYPILGIVAGIAWLASGWLIVRKINQLSPQGLLRHRSMRVAGVILGPITAIFAVIFTILYLILVLTFCEPFDGELQAEFDEERKRREAMNREP
jgi:hypothetical protein